MKNLKTAVLVLLAIFCTLNVAMAQDKLTIGTEGKTDYVIYHDPSAPDSIKTAAGELKSYFQKSAGFAPEIQTSATAPNSPFISLGNTPAARAAGLDTAKIFADGFRIATRGRNVYILGPDTAAGERTAEGGVSSGTANGVYSFCEEYLGVRWLFPGDLGEEIPRKIAIEVPASLDKTEIPAFKYRQLPYIGRGSAANTWARRMKVGKDNQFARVRHGHNWNIISPSLFDKHPDWFAEIGGKRQLPAGRYKLETTNPELVQAFADKAIEAFRADPNLKWFPLSPSDGGGFSESAASKALYDTAPNGEWSVTPLVLKFYNDVAKIVGKEFPDRKLGGYIYSNYLYPPSSGIPHIEPNLALTVAGGISAGYKLYRPDSQKAWDNVMRVWGEAMSKSGADIYSYDLPAYFKQNRGVITPPAPEILNFVFSRLDKYGYDGEYIYGIDSWEQSGPGNYAKAKLLWNPKLDAVELCREYYRAAYGKEAAPFIEQLYNGLDAGYNEFYNRNNEAYYNLTPEFLTELYGPRYAEIDALFLKARAAATEPKHQKRLRHFGHVLSVLQWNLKANNALPATYQSPLTLNNEQLDAAMLELGWHADNSEMPLETAKYRTELVETATPDEDGNQTTVVIPTRSDVRMLLHASQAGEVSIVSQTLISNGELVIYTLYDAETNKVLRTGALRAGRFVRFPAEAGKTYRFDVANTWSSLQLEVRGAVTAYKANALGRGFRVNAHELTQNKTPLAFQVPSGIKGFDLTINGKDIVADVVAPDGKTVGTIDTRSTSVARVQVKDGESQAGNWKLVLHKPEVEIVVVYIVLDSKLPQWLFPDPARNLKISTLP